MYVGVVYSLKTENFANPPWAQLTLRSPPTGFYGVYTDVASRLNSDVVKCVVTPFQAPRIELQQGGAANAFASNYRQVLYQVIIICTSYVVRSRAR